jgi:hypothetical protein
MSRWPPGDRTASSAVEIAAIPLAVTRAASAFSSAASFSCSAVWFGVLFSRMYLRLW